MRRLPRRTFLKGLGLSAAAALGGPVARGLARSAEDAAPARPNVVLILADDLGWRDTSLYGSTFYQTPHIDGLASRGMMFLQAYAANPLCSPTRASIMTGLYPARIGITTPACHLPKVVMKQQLPATGPRTHKALTPDSVTRLDRKYFTLAEALKAAGYVTGHFGKWHLGREPYDPLHQGFDADVPHWPGPGPAGSYLAPWKFPSFRGAPGEHIEDRMAAEAIAFLKASKDRPFFLNYWAFSVHAPYDAKKGLIEKYAARARADCPQRNPVMGAMIESLDENVGRVLAALDELKLADRTIVIFFSDNGGVNWPGSKGEGEERDCPITSNAPLRGGKASIYEGGTREPMIVVAPGVARPGTRSDELVSSIDLYPTVLDMLGLAPQAGLRFDGISIAPALKGRPLGRDTIFCHFPHYVPASGNLPATSVRKGDWKLIRFYADRDDQTDRYELYNLKDDLGETKDLAAGMPEKVRELAALIERHLADTGAVVPKPNPAYRRGAVDSVGGWTAAGTCTLSLREGELVVDSTGGDPYLIADSVPAVGGPLRVRVRMRCATAGQGQVFFTTGGSRRFHAGQRISFAIAHDGKWHDYEIALPSDGKLSGLRLDPGTAAGQVFIESIRLLSGEGEGRPAKVWTFGSAATTQGKP